MRVSGFRGFRGAVDGEEEEPRPRRAPSAAPSARPDATAAATETAGASNARDTDAVSSKTFVSFRENVRFLRGRARGRVEVRQRRELDVEREERDDERVLGDGDRHDVLAERAARVHLAEHGDGARGRARDRERAQQRPHQRDVRRAEFLEKRDARPDDEERQKHEAEAEDGDARGHHQRRARVAPQVRQLQLRAGGDADHRQAHRVRRREARGVRLPEHRERPHPSAAPVSRYPLMRGAGAERAAASDATSRTATARAAVPGSTPAETTSARTPARRTGGARQQCQSTKNDVAERRDRGGKLGKRGKPPGGSRLEPRPRRFARR